MKSSIYFLLFLCFVFAECDRHWDKLCSPGHQLKPCDCKEFKLTERTSLFYLQCPSDMDFNQYFQELSRSRYNNYFSKLTISCDNQGIQFSDDMFGSMNFKTVS